MIFTPYVLFFYLFVFFALLQIFYYLFFFSRLAFFKKHKAANVENNFPVSIIVCAFNEEANLKKNLPLLLHQHYFKNGKPNFEVVVVNDNSQDETFYLLNQLQQQYAHLHVIHLTQEAKLIPGKKFPLSMGIKSARYEHVLLTDADCMPASESWLQSMSACYTAQKQIVLGYSPFVKVAGWLNKKIRFDAAHAAIQYFSYALAKLPYMGVGRNLSYQRQLFIDNKGFSSHHHLLSGDDDLFINQVATSSNTAICMDKNAFVYTEPKQTEEEWHYQKKRHLSTGKHYKAKHQFLLGLYAFSHFLFWCLLVFCILFPLFPMYVAIVFVVRWLIQYITFLKCFEQLQEEDLIPFIWVFDVWLLFYHLKSIPSIFFKQKIHWK